MNKMSKSTIVRAGSGNNTGARLRNSGITGA